MKPLVCSFCGKDEEEAAKIIVKGAHANICDDCVALTSRIVWQHYQTGINNIREKQMRLEQPTLSRLPVKDSGGEIRAREGQ
jgi:ribosome-binding protein aMBF1 (putative translation factor)